MMLATFAVFALVMILLWTGWRRTSMVLAFLNLLYIAGLLIVYYAHSTLGIKL